MSSPKGEGISVLDNEDEENVESKYFENDADKLKSSNQTRDDRTPVAEDNTGEKRIRSAGNNDSDIENSTSKYFKHSEIERNENQTESSATEDNTTIQKESEEDIKNAENNEAESHVPSEHQTVDNTENEKTKRLSRSDFQKDGILQARYLLGKIVNHHTKGGVLRGRIVETEAYLGVEDKACHAYGDKRTERTQAMYMDEGTAYVYSIYGMYFCLNISSSEVGGATLIRALQPLEGIFLCFYVFLFICTKQLSFAFL